MDVSDINDLIRTFFDLGMQQSDILHSLAHYGYVLSHRHLRRILKKLQLSRRHGYSDISNVVTFINNELQSSGMLHGYRWMFHKCQNKGLKVVRLILYALDPGGCAMAAAAAVTGHFVDVRGFD